MKNINILTLFLLLNSVVFSQNIEFKSANFKDKKEELKKAEQAIDKGNDFLKIANEALFNTQSYGLNFKLALKEYMVAQNFNPNNGDLNFKIAVCHFNSNDPFKGIALVKRARVLDPKCSPFLAFYEGRAAQLEGKYDDAIKSFKFFETEYKKADNFGKFVTAHLKECAFAKTASAKPERVWIDNLEVVNSAQDDISPSISTDGGDMVFSSTRSNGHTTNEVGDYDYDIYSVSKTDQGWASPKKLEGAINGNTDDVANNLFYDGTKMLMHKSSEGQTDIFESKLVGATWSKPEGLHPNINTAKANETYGAYNNDGYKIYFSRANDNNANGTELFFSAMTSKMLKDFKIGTVVSAASSKFDDGPVYITIDGELMYVASKGHDGLGGYDIFVCKKTSTGWGIPANLGYPINTPYDDFFFAATANNKYAYISSNRAGGKGGFDLYQVTFWGPEKKPVISTEDYLLGSNAQPMKDQSIEATVSINKVSLTVFKGSTIDALTRKPVEASIEIYDNTSGKLIESFTTNSASGKFLITLTAGKNYGIAVKATGYLFHSENFDIPNGSEYNMVNKIIELKNIAIGSKIALRNVFFDLAKANLRPESNSELDRLVKLMKEVPKLKVEISGHTDNTGSAVSNESLSQLRADAVVNYLTSKGIMKDRLVAKGYGSTKPVSTNDNETGRQLNRRTEFEIKGN